MENKELIYELAKKLDMIIEEEIAKYITSVWFADNMHRECFKLGAIWMKEQILNQNKMTIKETKRSLEGIGLNKNK